MAFRPKVATQQDHAQSMQIGVPGLHGQIVQKHVIREFVQDFGHATIQDRLMEARFVSGIILPLTFVHTTLNVRFMEIGVVGPHGLLVQLHVKTGLSCEQESVTSPRRCSVDVIVQERMFKDGIAPLRFHVQWMECGDSGHNTHHVLLHAEMEPEEDYEDAMSQNLSLRAEIVKEHHLNKLTVQTVYHVLFMEIGVLGLNGRNVQPRAVQEQGHDRGIARIQLQAEVEKNVVGYQQTVYLATFQSHVQLMEYGVAGHGGPLVLPHVDVVFKQETVNVIALVQVMVEEIVQETKTIYRNAILASFVKMIVVLGVLFAMTIRHALM